MTLRLFYPILLFSLFSSAYAESPGWQLSLQAENMENGDAASVAIHTGEYLYGGMSLNYITSSHVIQSGNRQSIYPLFLFIGLRSPSPISPFIEAGADLPELIFDELFDDDEEDALDLTDYYLSGGLNITLSDSYSLSLYAKRYRFKYHETVLTNRQRVTADSYGAGLTLHF